MENQKLFLRMKVLAAIEMAPDQKIGDRIISASKLTYEDNKGKKYKFKWSTVNTWYYRFKVNGLTSIESKSRSDKGSRRKVCIEKIAESVNEVLPLIKTNKKNKLLVSTVYRAIIEKGYYKREDLSPTTFYRVIREKRLLDDDSNTKYRLAFSMQHANEMWQVDTMHGPHVFDPAQKKKRKTYFIAFIDDASRLITHGEFYFSDNEENLAFAFQDALAKRGKPEILYCDNGSNYSAKSIQMACLRLGVKLSHAPIRDGAAKGKIERFFRTFRDQFLTINHDLKNIDDLNRLATSWIEDEYNNRYHSAIQMKPIDRFGLDRNRIEYIPNEDYIDELFFVEESRKVNKDNTFKFDNCLYECPAHLRGEWMQIRFHPKKRDKILVYFNEQRMGQAYFVNLHFNARTFLENEEKKNEKKRKKDQDENQSDNNDEEKDNQ